MIDSHAHLFSEEFNFDLDEVISRAKANNVNKIMSVGFSIKTNDLAYDLASKYSMLYPTCGMHPSEAIYDIKELLTNLEDFIINHKIYAIGECGLDYHYDVDRNKQKILFEEQIKLAIKYNLPLIIHSRDAINDTYELLKKYPKCYGVMHCYSGSKEMALKFLDLGFYISLGGPVTFKNAKMPKEVASIVPLDKLLIETDSPYLAPMPNRGKRNEPSYVRYVLEEISKIKNIDVLELDKITENNTIKLFKLEANRA